MGERLSRFFPVDDYTDPVQRQRAFNLFFIDILLMLASTVLLFVLILTNGPTGGTVRVIVGLAFLVAIGLISYQLNTNGWQRAAAWLILLTLLGTVIGLTILGGSGTGFTITSSYAIWLVLIFSSVVLTSSDILLLTETTTALIIIAFFTGVRVDEVGFIHAEGYLEIFYLFFTISVGAIAWVVSRNFGLISALAKLSEASRQLVLTKTSASVSQRIFARLELETLLKDTVEQIREQFEDVYHAQVFLIAEDRKTAVLRASTGEVGKALIEKKHTLAVGSASVIGRVTEVGVPVLASDASSDSVHKANELLPNTLTELAIPLRSREGIIGALDVQSTKRNAFSQEDIDILQTLADQIAVAVENARLFEDAQEEAERAKAIAEASQITNRMTVDFERGLQALFEAVAKPGQYTHWWLGVLEPDGQHITCVTHYKADPVASPIPQKFNLQTDKNTLIQAIKIKKPIIENNVMVSTSFDENSSAVFTTFGKHIAAPIFQAGTEVVEGVLLVGRSRTASDLAERDLELVGTLTSQISTALETRRLFNRVQDDQRTLQSVLDTMPISVVVVDKQGSIILANEQARQLLGEKIQPGNLMDQAYPIYQTGTRQPYPKDELPLNFVLTNKKAYAAEDLVVMHPDGVYIDVLSKAAPILDAQDNIYAVVSVYQDITELRELERALQESLSETTQLYEASRSISHANTVKGVGDAVVGQMLSLSPNQIYVTLLEQNQYGETYAELILSWPNSAVQNIDDLTLPQSVIMPTVGLGTTNLTFATKNLHLLPGIQEDELKRLREQGIQALTVLPLEARGQVFGAIIGVFKTERHFAPEERRFLLTLADQTAVALDAVLSFERTQQTLQSISKLYQASRAIAEVQDVDEALEVIQQQISLLEPDRIEVALARDQDGLGELELALKWSSDGTEYPIIPSNGNLPFDVLSRDEYFIEDVRQAVNKSPLATYLLNMEAPYRAVASLPFRAAGQPTGRLTVGFKGRHQFSNEDRQFLRMLADSTAYVIENDMLFKQTQDSLEETGILYQAIRAFANAEDKEGILQAIIDYAADPAVDKALLCLLLTESWDSSNALMEVMVSWVRGDSVDLTGMRFTAEQFPSWEQISTNEILWVDDVMQDPTLDETARMGYRALDIASFAVVPLAMSGAPIGAILLGSAEPRHHSEREVRIYQSLADQAAITMENIRLYEEAERRARQLSTSARVSQAASSILKINELLPEMVDLIKDAFGYDHVQVFLLNDGETDAILQASTGEAGRQLLAIRHSLEVGSRSVIGTVTATGKPSIALDTADARVIHKPNPYLPNTRSEMAIPLISKGKILGALDVQSNQPGAFTEGDVRVLSILADQLAVAIENASLFELSQQRSEEMSFLFTVTAESTTTGELQDVLQRVSELLLPQMDASVVIPYLYNDIEQTLEVGAVAGEIDNLPVDGFQAVPMSADKAIIHVASNKMPIMLRKIGADNVQQAIFPQMQSGVYMPLITGERLIGVLALESEEAYKFDNSVLNLLQAFTGSLAAVIQNQTLLADIQAANERLREIDKLKTNFLAAMSHELRTPLNSIIGFSRVILKGIDGPITDMQEQDLQTIHDSGKHLLGLVNDILDQAKIEAGKMELSMEYFDLETVIKGVMSSAEGLTKEKPIRLYSEIDSSLPQAYGDEFRTRQVLFNLISNAAKFTEQGSITTSAIVIEEKGVPFIQVAVTDTGIGIRQEDFGKLFESFQQVDNSTTRSAEGTGLGLPLAKSLTELQGGKIWVESEYGVGSTFSVTIPTQPAQIEDTEDTQPLEVPASNGKSAPVQPKTIMVIEDNLDMINFYRRHLSNNGYDIIGILHPKDVIPKLMQVRPLAIIVNVNIEGDSGWDILAEIADQEFTKHIPTIVSSLHEDSERSLQLSAAMHLVRPFTPEDLILAIQQVEDRVSS